jgi:putative hydrolase of the HAD superfamily
VPISHLVFDLDDTLYPPGNGLWDEIGERINRFMVERAGIDPAKVNDVRRQYYVTYGTSLRGLMTDFPNIDPHAYLAFVHDVDLSRYIAPNPALNSLLAALPQPKSIFTNSDANHTLRVLNCLGVARHFPLVVDIHAMKFENKPRPQAYEALLKTIGAPANECLIVEDSLRNLRPAKALGFTTLLVGNGHEPDPAVDHRVSTILEAGPLIQSLSNGDHRHEL